MAVFLYLAKQTNLDLSSVARKFDLSTKNLSIYLREIQEDLATLPENTLEIQIHHGKISLHTTSNDFLSHYFYYANCKIKLENKGIYGTLKLYFRRKKTKECNHK